MLNGAQVSPGQPDRSIYEPVTVTFSVANLRSVDVRLPWPHTQCHRKIFFFSYTSMRIDIKTLLQFMGAVMFVIQ